MRISWIDPKDLIEYEIQQLVLEGKNVDRLNSDWNSIKLKTDNEKEVLKFKDYLYEKYNQSSYFLEERKKLEYFIDRKVKSDSIKYDLNQLSESELYDKLYGGWVGRASGCLLGKPIEKYSRSIIKEILTVSKQWPLQDYISGKNIPGEILQKYPWNKHSGKESLKENIEYMTEDDDLNYAMINLNIAEYFGTHFTTENVAETWLELLPVLSTFTAERVAYFNLLDQINPMDTALINNPYRDWIGALIRADLWGWISPGNPEQAVRCALKDATLTHLNNGILGAVFISALLSMAFFIKDIDELIESAIKFIPEESEIYEALLFSVSVSRKNKDWEWTLDNLYQRFDHLHWVHVINNSALIIASLLYGKNDFEKSICAAVMGGWDTDSNAATVGSVVGTIQGYKKLPKKWVRPLNNKIRSSIKGYDFSKFDELAKRTSKVIQNNREKR